MATTLGTLKKVKEIANGAIKETSEKEVKTISFDNISREDSYGEYTWTLNGLVNFQDDKCNRFEVELKGYEDSPIVMKCKFFPGEAK